MCGIAGIVSLNNQLRQESDFIKKMTSTLAKRGPNDEGYAFYPHAHLGHRRLIVVDPSGGAQPMHREHDGNKYTIVYNGELYNTEEIRSSLKELGFSFKSYSDTEVLLCAFVAWGADCVSHINGIYAFGVWDEKNQTLFLCRDPLGVKPLYYTVRDDILLFGSELKTLFAHPLAKPVLDKTGICEIMGLGPAHSLNSGVFKDIYQLPPAHFLLYSEKGMKLQEYWKLQSLPHEESEGETLLHVRDLLLDAIKRQLVSDVPVCTFLSGGLDSSIISAVAAAEFKKRGETLKTFSINYEDNDKYQMKTDFVPDSDDAWVDVMADFIGSSHTKVIFDNRALTDALYDAVIANDMPGMADIDSSLFLFCREIRKQSTVALSGECADEIFGGYPWYLRPDLAAKDTFPWSNSVKERKALLSPALGNVPLEDYVQWQYEDTVSRVPKEPDGSVDPMKKLFFLNIKWFMNTLLTRKDRMSMANSLEVRVPFADYRLVEYTFNIPSHLKFLNGREKGLLRKALEGLLPEEILWRKKSPYPKTFHPQYTEFVQKWINSLLANKNARILEIVDKNALTDIVESGGRSFGRPWFGQLMTGPQLIAYLLQLELWMQKYGAVLDI